MYKDQNPRLVVFVLFLFLKTYKLKVSCLLKDLCKKRSHYLSKMCDLICGGHIGFHSFTPVARLLSNENRKCCPENSLLLKRQIDNPSPGAVTGGN